ncbi:MAG: DUF554 domain-containing protein [Oscillospiraceae bacterium]|jgi:uncharacterized membrane protein YqgA involved in biofilm formation|nr:DUF554 domain-containing protein [Oscillospiraceae bacterium]
MRLPIGGIINSAAVALGGASGALFGKKLSENWKSTLMKIMGMCALVISFVYIPKLQSLPTVMLAMLAGVLIGEAIGLDKHLNKALEAILKKAKLNRGADWLAQYRVIFALFAFSGTGIFGILREGFTGDPSVLVTKAILDFCCAMSFAASMGYAVSAIAAAQFTVYIILFPLATLLYPHISQDMIANFNAVGGCIDLAIGLSILDVYKFRPVNFLPGFILVFPLTLLFAWLF